MQQAVQASRRLEAGDIVAGFAEPPAREPLQLGDVPGVASEVLASRITFAFRRHGHIGNVLTHVCGGNWTNLQKALRHMLDATAAAGELDPLTWNILEVLCAERGVTGRIARPYFRELLACLLGPQAAARKLRQIDCLYAKGASRSGPPSSGMRSAGDTAS